MEYKRRLKHGRAQPPASARSLADVLPHISSIKVVGYAFDAAGIEALVVEVNGSILRLDNKIYHITMSLDRTAGFKPVDSNTLISQKGFTKLTHAINIDAIAKFI